MRRSLGEKSYTIRFTLRRKGSIWGKVNVERFAALKAGGFMTRRESGHRRRARGRAEFTPMSDPWPS